MSSNPAPAPGWSAAIQFSSSHAALVEAAERIIDRGLWCVVEICVDVPRQDWERRLTILRRDGRSAAEVVADWIRTVPCYDVRLSGCRRTDLRLVADAPSHLCYLARAEAAPGLLEDAWT